MSTYGGYDTYGTTSTAVGALGAMVVVFFVIIIGIALAVSVCSIVGQWKALKKAGKNGWEALIPYYNNWTFCNVVGINPWWVIVVLVSSLVLSYIPYIGSILSYAISIYFTVILNVSVARSFGKSDGYAAGLIFLAPIFWLMLGGKNAQYVGAKPMNDVVMNFVYDKILNKPNPYAGDTGMNMNANMNNSMNQNMNMGGFQQNQPMDNIMNNTNPNPQASKFCTSCGYQITNGERFCPGCGKEVQ